MWILLKENVSPSDIEQCFSCITSHQLLVNPITRITSGHCLCFTLGTRAISPRLQTYSRLCSPLNMLNHFQHCQHSICKVVSMSDLAQPFLRTPDKADYSKHSKTYFDCQVAWLCHSRTQQLSLLLRDHVSRPHIIPRPRPKCATCHGAESPV